VQIGEHEHPRQPHQVRGAFEHVQADTGDHPCGMSRGTEWVATIIMAGVTTNILGGGEESEPGSRRKVLAVGGARQEQPPESARSARQAEEAGPAFMEFAQEIERANAISRFRLQCTRR
jgi:hypothetical protein